MYFVTHLLGASEQSPAVMDTTSPASNRSDVVMGTPDFVEETEEEGEEVEIEERADAGDPGSMYTSCSGVRKDKKVP